MKFNILLLAILGSLFIQFVSFSQATLNLGDNVIICSANGTATITANATDPGTTIITSYAWSINSNSVGTSTSSLNVSGNTTTSPQIVSCIVTLNNNNVLYDTVQVFTTIPTITTTPSNQCVANGGSATYSLTKDKSIAFLD